MEELNSPMAASWIRAFANSSPDTPSRPTVHNARRWITSCSPILPSRQRHAQQWYVTISRGRRGIRIFTPDKEQLSENVARSGHRPLAIEFVSSFAARRPVRLWDRLRGYLLRFG